MSATFNVPLTTTYQFMYLNILEMLPSINPSMPMAHTRCRMRSGTGSVTARVQTNVGQTSMTPVVGTQVTNANTDIALSNRWVTPQQYYTRSTLSNVQAAFTQTWPVGQYVMAQINAALKVQENLFFQGLSGVATVGGNTSPSGTTPVAFPIQNVVGVDGTLYNPDGSVRVAGTGVAQPFNSGSIRKMKMLAQKNYEAFSLGSMQPWIAIGPEANLQLGSEIQLINSLYANQQTGNRAALGQGYADGFLGVNILMSNELPTAYSLNPILDPTNIGYSVALVWFDAGMCRGIWAPPTPRVHMDTNPVYELTYIDLTLNEGYSRVMEEMAYAIVYDPRILN